MVTTGKKTIDDFLYLIRCAIKQEPLQRTDFATRALFELAKRQQVYNLILPCLQEGGLLNDEEAQNWKDYYLSELQKTILVDSERAAICHELDARGIRYMLVKGLEIRAYYPQSFMRQMSDNDILYDASRRDELVAVMKQHGYYIGASGGISDDFYKKPYCTFEFHRQLFNPEEPFCPEFNPWLHATPYGNGTSRQVISREDNYLYAIGHMYKHYYCIDGCGLRFICDAYLLAHSQDELDWAFIHAELERFGIAGFHQTVVALADAVFEDGALTQDAAALLDVMLEGGVFGTYRNRVNDEIEQYGSKTRFLLHRLFPSMAMMRAEYRVLNQKPYLLPFYYLYRLIDKYRHNRKYMQRDLQALKKTHQKHEDK